MSLTLTVEEASSLINLARKTVKEYLTTKIIGEPPENISKKFLMKRGTFVTLNKLINNEKKLRGCIGFPYPTFPLVESVIKASIEAALRDPRFKPISLDEFKSIIFEVSILTLPKLIKISSPKDYLSKIKIGRDGLIVENGSYRGLLLPQVPVEWKWDVESFLCQSCLKAGLTPDCWILKETRIYSFQCIIAQETEPEGQVKLIQDISQY